MAALRLLGVDLGKDKKSQELRRHVQNTRMWVTLFLILSEEVPRWLKGIKKLILNLNLGNFDPEEKCSTVYAVISLRNSKTYVGETGRSAMERFGEHNGDAKRYTERKGKWEESSLIAKQIAKCRDGEYFPIPIWFKKKGSTDEIIWRKYKEKKMIQALQPALNKRHKSRFEKPKHQMRRVISQREKMGKKTQGSLKPEFTTYIYDSILYYDLSDIYHELEEGEIISVEMEKGKHDLTTIPKLLTMRYEVNGKWKSIFRSLWNKSKGITTLTILKTKGLRETDNFELLRTLNTRF